MRDLCQEPRGSGNGAGVIGPVLLTPPTQQSTPDGFKLFCWGGRMHMVKEGFQVPSLNPMVWWSAYWEPNRAEHIQALRHLQPYDLMNSNQRASWSKSKYLLKDMTKEFIAMEGGINEARIVAMTVTERDALFQKHFENYMFTKVCDGDAQKVSCMRLGSIVLNTLYDKVKAYNVSVNNEKSTKRRKVN
jgi:hypothetical protein